jgi:hypothetical protein
MGAAWIGCVAFGFGTIEAHWLLSNDPSYQTVAIGILFADLVSAWVYWSGWTLRRVIATMLVAVVVTIACLFVVATARPAFAIAAAGILAAPLLVHSASVSMWFREHLARRKSESNLLRLASLMGITAIAFAVSWLVTRFNVAHFLGRADAPATFAAAVVIACGTVAGMAFWFLFKILARRIDHPANAQLRQVLQEFVAPFAGAPQQATAISPLDQGDSRMNVFVAYSRADIEEVRRLCDFLEGEGVEVFWDQKLAVGQNWREVLHRGIRDARKVIVCFSSEIDRRDRSELYAELREMADVARTLRPRTTYILPVRLTDCTIPDIRIDALTTLSSLQHADLFPASQWDRGVRAVLQEIRNGR